jgi:class 3 adenylate cyclase
MDTNANTTPPARNGEAGLASVSQVVELADQLSACADQIHERVMREIRAYKGGAIPEAKQDAARALLDDEVVLRQRANGLYADAATYIVRSLGKPQQHVLALTADAAEKIKKITQIGDAVSLVARLLGLAAAAATGQAAPIVLALENLHHQLDAIALHNAPPPPPAPPA